VASVLPKVYYVKIKEQLAHKQDFMEQPSVLQRSQLAHSTPA
jgi:hypothetical protein